MLQMIQMNDSLLFLLFGRQSLIAENLYPKISKRYERVKSFHLCKKDFTEQNRKVPLPKRFLKVH